MQINLFDNSHEHIPITIDGLTHISNYISEAEEAKLIGTIDQQPWLHDLKRRVQHYGYKYDYKARTVTPELKIGALPNWIDAIATKLFLDKFVTQKPDQAIINEYIPGQGISSHIDCIPCFSSEIVSLSLAGTCVMDFNHCKTNQKIFIQLQPRDLLIFSGSARYEWLHGIAARKSDTINGQNFPRIRRISITFRKVVLS